MNMWLWVLYSVESRATIDVFTTKEHALESVKITYTEKKGFRLKIHNRSSLVFIDVEMDYPKGTWSHCNEFEIRCHQVYDKPKTL
jgi:hypothetical protein